MDLDDALSDIEEIRSHLAGQALFQGLGPVSVACSGVLALLVALAQVLWPGVLAESQSQSLFVWIFATFLSSIFIAVHMWSRAKALHGTQSGAMLNRIFEQLVPPVFVVLVITFALMKFADTSLNMLPGIWLLIASLATFAMSVSLGNRMRLVAVWYFIAGAVVLVAGLQHPGALLSPWYLGVSFLLGQIAMAIVLKLESRST